MADWKVLLVEGLDDKHVLKQICRSRGILDLDEVAHHDGNRDLLKTIPTWLKASEEKEGAVVGVVIDADTYPGARWQSIRDKFIAAGYSDMPTDRDPTGTIVEPPCGSLLPRIGIWIMPDNKTSGVLEDFLRFLIPQQDALFDHANASVDCIPAQRFKDQDKLKAIIHTWLAWQEKPGRPYGTAIAAGFLDPGLPQADVLVSWLKRLFDQPKASP